MPQTKSVKYWTFAFNRMYHLKFNYQIFNEVESSSVDIGSMQVRNVQLEDMRKAFVAQVKNFHQ
jgi:hypothetical protein